MIYPNEYELETGRDYPSKEEFTVNHCETKGSGIYVKRSFKKGEMVARMAGITVPYILQHTLQISPFLHLYDPHFTGLLLHSCDPLVSLDMNKLEIWALRDIEKGDALTMDYAQTEDKLFKQFPCSCGAINCRKWVTGRKESINEAGQRHLLELERKCG
ncbi:SET domain-containing protein-lysine N-methyltransferase [Desulfobacter curvatus]|uniref:SET domain-containing protein-lysine N-methyltransferase n=1 Tax=Desulfobacter curvatus TaxID=2290 RepID=UPI000364F9B4|nr:SET domain-containing protein-lysine N-methyltransferase [Desulfobacter curvatus]